MSALRRRLGRLFGARHPRMQVAALCLDPATGRPAVNEPVVNERVVQNPGDRR